MPARKQCLSTTHTDLDVSTAAYHMGVRDDMAARGDRRSRTGRDQPRGDRGRRETCVPFREGSPRARWEGCWCQPLESLREGSTVVVHYTLSGEVESAQEIDYIGDDGLLLTEGSVTRIDRGRKEMAIRFDRG